MNRTPEQQKLPPGPWAAVVQYFSNLRAGIVTTALGMKLTFSYLVSKPFTMLYPEVRPVLPPAHRGLHAYDEGQCTCCKLCTNVCPVDCMTVETLGKGKDAMLLRFDIDYSKCLFCNLCAESCPAAGLRLTEKFDLACGSREGCILHLARPKSEAEIAEHKARLAQKEAERQAQREAAKKS